MTREQIEYIRSALRGMQVGQVALVFNYNYPGSDKPQLTYGCHLYQRAGLWMEIVAKIFNYPEEARTWHKTTHAQISGRELRRRIPDHPEVPPEDILIYKTVGGLVRYCVAPWYPCLDLLGDAKTVVFPKNYALGHIKVGDRLMVTGQEPSDGPKFFLGEYTVVNTGGTYGPDFTNNNNTDATLERCAGEPGAKGGRGYRVVAIPVLRGIV